MYIRRSCAQPLDGQGRAALVAALASTWETLGAKAGPHVMPRIGVAGDTPPVSRR